MPELTDDERRRLYVHWNMKCATCGHIRVHHRPAEPWDHGDNCRYLIPMEFGTFEVKKRPCGCTKFEEPHAIDALASLE